MGRVAVIGGGLAGAASAVRLAKLGHQVTLVERLTTVGGAVGFVERDGFRWDAGPSSTAVPAVLRDLFRKSGRPLEKELDLVPVQPLREHRFPGGSRVILPSGSRAAQLAAVEEGLGTGLGRQWVDYVHDLAGPWDLLRRDYLERPYTSGLAAEDTERLLRSRTSLHKAVGRRFTDARLRHMAFHHVVQSGQDPRDVPFWMGLLDYLEQNFGTWTFTGGFGNLAGLLGKRLAERRVEVLTSTTATDIEMGPAGPLAVRTDAGPVRADRVVVAVDPRRLPALAGHVRRTSSAMPPRVTHLGLGGGVPELPPEVVLHGTHHLTVRSGGTAPEGKAAWTVLTRGSSAEDPVVTLARSGIDVRDAVECRVDRSPHELVAHLSGSPYGVQWRGRATLRRRLTAATPLPHVYAAGAHVGGGGWVPFVGLTAAVVAQEVGPA